MTDATLKHIEELLEQCNMAQDLQADMIMKINIRLDALEQKKGFWQRLFPKKKITVIR